MKLGIRSKIISLYRSVAANERCRKLNELIFDCAIHGLGILNYENDRLTGERHFVESVLPRYLHREGSFTVVDVGANEGSYEELILSKFKTARCICVEPHPITFRALEKRLASRCVFVNCALGANSGTLTLYDRADQNGSQHATMYREVITDLHRQAVTTHQVPVKTLDEMANDLQLSRIDLLKIDAEGHELEVLRGARKLLAAGLIGVLHIEFNEMNIFSRVFLRDFREMLPSHKAFRMLPSSIIPVSTYPLGSELFAFQNIVFLPNR
ncbi:MAG TPA: FkbM family methyltransferase [Terrimicrobiaceae bacterium]